VATQDSGANAEGIKRLCVCGSYPVRVAFARATVSHPGPILAFRSRVAAGRVSRTEISQHVREDDAQRSCAGPYADPSWWLLTMFDSRSKLFRSHQAPQGCGAMRTLRRGLPVSGHVPIGSADRARTPRIQVGLDVRLVGAAAFTASKSRRKGASSTYACDRFRPARDRNNRHLFILLLFTVESTQEFTSPMRHRGLMTRCPVAL